MDKSGGSALSADQVFIFMELKQCHFFKGNIGSEMLKMGHISPLIVGCHAAWSHNTIWYR